MTRKIVAMLTTVTAALLIVGVAWASSDDSGELPGATDGSTDTSVGPIDSSDDESTRTTIIAASASTSTPTSQPDTTSTSLDDETTVTTAAARPSTTLESSTSTSVATTTSTSATGSASTTVDDSRIPPPNGVSTYAVGDVGAVTIEVRDGALILRSVVSPGWQQEVEKEEWDRIEIEFHSGDAEADFEARIDHGAVAVEVEMESD